MIFEWLKQRKIRLAKKRYRAGYDFAVVSLLRGDKTENEIREYANNSFDRDEFDRGLVAGLDAVLQRDAFHFRKGKREARVNAHPWMNR